MILLVLWEWFCSFWLQLISKTSNNVRWKADTFNSAMFQDVSISLPRHEVTPQRTRRNWNSKSGLKHLRDVYVTFIHYLLSLLGLVSPTSWTDRSFELTLLLLVFTQAFHKISIKTSINNTENMPQLTRSNNSAISIDNDASDLWLLVNFNCAIFLGWSWKVCSGFVFRRKKRHSCCDWSRTPSTDPSDQPSLRSMKGVTVVTQ